MPDVADGIAGAIRRRCSAVAGRCRRRLARDTPRGRSGRPSGGPLRRDEGRSRPRRRVRSRAVPARRADRRDHSSIQVDYDDRDLRINAPRVRLPADRRPRWRTRRSGLRSNATSRTTSAARSRLDLPTNSSSSCTADPARTPMRSRRAVRSADDHADAEIAKLRDKYETKATSLRDKIEAAEDRIEELEEQTEGQAQQRTAVDRRVGARRSPRWPKEQGRPARRPLGQGGYRRRRRRARPRRRRSVWRRPRTRCSGWSSSSRTSRSNSKRRSPRSTRRWMESTARRSRRHRRSREDRREGDAARSGLAPVE